MICNHQSPEWECVVPVEFVSGDVFINRVGAEALGHGCNCAGSMGAGIAVGFEERYPAMFDEYRRRCKATPQEFGTGDVITSIAAPRITAGYEGLSWKNVRAIVEAVFADSPGRLFV